MHFQLEKGQACMMSTLGVAFPVASIASLLVIFKMKINNITEMIF